MQTSSRPENHNTLNLIIYNNDKPMYFCKVCRDYRHNEPISQEAKNLELVDNLLSNSELSANYPRLIKCDDVKGVLILVMSFVKGRTAKYRPNLDLSRNNLKQLDKYIKYGITNLIKFQNITKFDKVNGTEYLLDRIHKNKIQLKKTNKLTPLIMKLLTSLEIKIKNEEYFDLSLSATQGDYDFDNILFNKSSVSMVDFEHFEIEGFPFYDLAHLIYNPLIIAYENTKGKLSFNEYLIRKGLHIKVNEWLDKYAIETNTPINIVRLTGHLIAIEQQVKQYSYFRNPESFPMYTCLALDAFSSNY